MNTRYAIVGTGGRHKMYRNALLNRYGNQGELVALTDTNPGRAALSAAAVNNRLGIDIAACDPATLKQLLVENAADCLIVTTMDSSHDDYICAALAAGVNVITEKPMTTSLERLQRILDARRNSSSEVTVAFNYRYSPVRSQVKQLLREGIIGQVHSVEFHWLLDTRHGADYFRRWHRRMENSGGLLVHKATHHFDLVNWWLDSVPEQVVASADLRYYTPGRAADLGLVAPGKRCSNCEEASRCPFHIDLAASRAQASLYLAQEQHDGYFRDSCVFSPDIDIHDNMMVNVRYRGGQTMSYTLHAYAPSEGYTIAFNGDRGRLEHTLTESPYMSADGGLQGASETATITHKPHFAPPQTIDVAVSEGDHGGGDALMLEAMFTGDASGVDPLQRTADYRAGAWSCIVGIAANESIRCGQPIRIADLVTSMPLPPGANP